MGCGCKDSEQQVPGTPAVRVEDPVTSRLLVLGFVLLGLGVVLVARAVVREDVNARAVATEAVS